VCAGSAQLKCKARQIRAKFADAVRREKAKRIREAPLLTFVDLKSTRFLLFANARTLSERLIAPLFGILSAQRSQLYASFMRLIWTWLAV
jgi:hypothetical protein